MFQGALCAVGKGRATQPYPISQRFIVLGALTVIASLLVLVGCVRAPTTSPATALPHTEVPKTGYPSTDTEGPVESAPSDGSTPITVRLILSKAPKLGEPVDLTFIVSSILDAPGATATILLPDGAIVMDGDLEWVGDLGAKEPLTLRASMKFVDEGNWTIEAKALRELETGDVWGDAAYIYLYVTEEAGHVGFSTETPPRSSDQEAPTPPTPPPVDASE